MTTDMTQTDAVLLAGHGSRRDESNEQVRAVADRLDDRLEGPVMPAFIELTEPLLHEGIDTLADRADSVTVVPLTLFAAGHVKNDVPLVVEHARQTYDGVSFNYGSHLGVRPEMVDIVADRIAAAEAEMAVDRDHDDIAVVFCSRGSSDPDANAEAYRLARLVYEGRAFSRIEPSFIGITDPVLDETLAGLAAHDPDGVIVVPYMLGDGVLNQRIIDWVAEFDTKHPEIETATTDVLGIDKRMIDVLVDRIEEARTGAVSMSCDTCKYKVSLADFEDEVGGETAFVESLEHTLAHVSDEHSHDHGGHSHSHDSEEGHEHSHNEEATHSHGEHSH